MLQVNIEEYGFCIYLFIYLFIGLCIASMQAMVEPHNSTVEVTTSVSLSCVVNGFEMDNVSYIWEVSETGGGTEASWQRSATSSHLLLNNVTTSAAYRCIATNSSGTIAISAISYITVVGKLFVKEKSI